MTPGRPFVMPPDPVWFACCECNDVYDGRYGHICPAQRQLADPLTHDPLGVSRGVLIALSIAILAWIAVLAGVVPFRLGWFG